MNKKLLLLSAIIMFSGMQVLAAPNNLEKIDEKDKQPAPSIEFDRNTVYYPNANLNSAIAKYKRGNYSGCLQELFSLTKKQPRNAGAYYYMAMAYSRVGAEAEAIEAYEKVIHLNTDSTLVEYATKGRDCLTGGPACVAGTVADETQDELDRFINSPYGNGMSDEVNLQNKQHQLKKIQETINQNKELQDKDIEKIKNLDNSKSYEEEIVVGKIAEVSDEEVVKALRTLKEAGMELTVQQNPIQQYQDPRMLEMSMLLGNNNNNNNYNDNMMNMLMYSQNGKNLDPRVIQAMMMNSMMSNFNYNDNRY